MTSNSMATMCLLTCEHATTCWLVCVLPQFAPLLLPGKLVILIRSEHCGTHRLDNPLSLILVASPTRRYAYAALQRALELNRNIWHSDSFEKRATALAEGIRQGAGSGAQHLTVQLATS